MKKTLILGALLVAGLFLYGCATPGNSTVKCSFTEDGEKTTAYINGNVVYMEGVTAEGINTKGLVKDDVMYVRSDESTDGFKIDFSTLTGDDFKIDENVIRTTSDLISAVKSKSSDCAAGDTDLANFNLPEGINFQGGF